MKIKKLKILFNKKNLVNIAFEIKNSLALVGQSGSGKSLTLKALLKMLPYNMTREIEVDVDFDLDNKKNIAFVPQNPFTALSPLTKIKKQFFSDMTRIKELFQQVDLDINILDRYPPELSGGQLQRVVIAIALEFKPKLLMLDEPTTALDPKTRVIILDLLIYLQKKMEFKILFVTHDIASAKYLCEDICIIKDGLVVEDGKMSKVLENPKEDYTKILIESNFSNRNFRS